MVQRYKAASHILLGAHCLADHKDLDALLRIYANCVSVCGCAGIGFEGMSMFEGRLTRTVPCSLVHFSQTLFILEIVGFARDETRKDK